MNRGEFIFQTETTSVTAGSHYARSSSAATHTRPVTGV